MFLWFDWSFTNKSKLKEVFLIFVNKMHQKWHPKRIIRVWKISKKKVSESPKNRSNLYFLTEKKNSEGGVYMQVFGRKVTCISQTRVENLSPQDRFQGAGEPL